VERVLEGELSMYLSIRGEYVGLVVRAIRNRRRLKIYLPKCDGIS